MQETHVQTLGQEDPLQKEIATHSSILAWESPWTEEPGGLQSTWLQRVGHNWSDTAHTNHQWERWISMLVQQVLERTWESLSSFEAVALYFIWKFVIQTTGNFWISMDPPFLPCYCIKPVTSQTLANCRAGVSTQPQKLRSSTLGWAVCQTMANCQWQC